MISLICVKLGKLFCMNKTGTSEWTWSHGGMIKFSMVQFEPLNNCNGYASYVSLDVFSQNSLPVHNNNKSGGKRWKYPRPPRSVYSTTWLYCDAVISWNSLSDHFVKSRLNSISVEAPFHYPQMVLHVQWWDDCGTVHKQLSKQLIKCFTVKCTPPQSKRIGFEIKNAESRI